MNTNFASWLQIELEKKNWSQSELVRQARANGHKLTTSQVSRILNEEQFGTAEVVIAIASGLELPRWQVFQARGWLPYSKHDSELQFSPEAAQVALKIDTLPPELRQVVLQVTQATATALRQAQQGLGSTS